MTTTTLGVSEEGQDMLGAKAVRLALGVRTKVIIKKEKSTLGAKVMRPHNENKGQTTLGLNMVK